uniref:Uncharacterized protein n=1 Tax=Yersinia pestis Java 9 TaxID=880632 RepID=E8PSB3_YERPE|nr:hypothetical protein YPJ_pPCP15 [Yersinia pestis Java 9]
MGFFVYRQQITRRKKGSQEDPLIFSTELRSRSVQQKIMMGFYGYCCGNTHVT